MFPMKCYRSGNGREDISVADFALSIATVPKLKSLVWSLSSSHLPLVCNRESSKSNGNSRQAHGSGILAAKTPLTMAVASGVYRHGN